MENDRLTHLRGLVETRQWDKAWAEFQQLKEEVPASAWLLFLGSMAAHGQKDLFKARHLAESALATWSAAKESYKVLGHVRFQLGHVARKLGDTHVALEQFQLFLADLSSKYPELSMAEGKAHFYLALTHRQRRNLDEAVTTYQQAIACFRRDELTTDLCAGLQNLAWLLCHMRHPEEAEAFLSESANLIRTSEDRVHQILGEAFHASITGKLLVATELCQSIFHMAERGEVVTAEEQSQAAWIAGTVALEQENLESAWALAGVALAYATEAKDSRLMNDANALRQSVHAKRQQAGAC